MERFYTYTDYETDRKVFVKISDISLVTEFTEREMYEKEKYSEEFLNKLDNKKLITGICTKSGIVHVKEDIYTVLRDIALDDYIYIPDESLSKKYKLKLKKHYEYFYGTEDKVLTRDLANDDLYMGYETEYGDLFQTEFTGEEIRCLKFGGNIQKDMFEIIEIKK
ncbi:MAG: hypothetical protein ACTJGH_00335 [Peptoniphilaceae bacterium]